MSSIKVVDRNYQIRDLEWAKKNYGFDFTRAEVAEGEKVFRLVEIWEKTGHTSIITQVLNKDGTPRPNQGVALYWPDAPDPPEPDTEIWEGDWHPNFVWGLTNLNGEVGPSMGTGAYVGRGDCGPHQVWVRDPDIPTDLAKCLGMIAGTFHDHLDLKFKLEVHSDDGNGGNGNGDDNGDNGNGDDTSWIMKVYRKQGPRLLIGVLPPAYAKTAVCICDPWWNCVNVAAGSKPEYGPGGFETPIWTNADYRITFLDAQFDVTIKDETVICVFEEGTPVPTQARLVSIWMDKKDAEEIWAELENGDYPEIFEIEDKD